MNDITSIFSDEQLKKGRQMQMIRGRTAMAIGRLMMKFNQYERDLGECLAAFLKRDSQEQHFSNIEIMTAALSFNAKLDLLTALYLQRYRSIEYSDQCIIFKRIIMQFSKFEEYRNAIAHSRWGSKTFGDFELRRFKENIKGRKGLRQGSELVDWRKIRQVVAEMSAFDIEVDAIYNGCSEINRMASSEIELLGNRLALREKNIFSNG
jgi:hypothetical protein